MQTEKGDYPGTHSHHGHAVSSGVRKVIWRGGPLSDDRYDEFVLVAYLADSLTPGSVLYFPVTQTCEQGANAWTDVPPAAQSRPRMPAPGLKLLAKPVGD